MSDRPALVAEGVAYSYGGPNVVQDLSLSLVAGDRLALTGPNGSGKTTLLRILSGARRPMRGRTVLGGSDLRQMNPRDVARRIAVVAQHVDPSLAFTVDDLVAMGRTPHLSPLGSLSRADRHAIDRSLDAVDATHLARRQFSELSGGEQQRVMVALALAQETDFLLLDEPTVHLDLHHQHEILELLTRLQRERGIGLLAVMHDLNLASLYFDRLAVMQRGSLVADDTPESVLADPDVLSVFEAPLSVITHPRNGVPQVLLDRND